LRGAQRELTRRRLVKAAREAFEEKGYADVSVDDIVKRAGASRATFYLHYASKSAVLLDAISDLNRGIARLSDQLARPELPSAEQMEDYLRMYVKFYADNREVFRARAQAEAIEPEGAGWFEDYFEDFVEPWRALGLFSREEEPEFRVAASLFLAQIERVLFVWLVQGFDLDYELTISALVRSWRGTLELGLSSPEGR
jgi:AcrR family transcriptional regulator